MPIAIKSNTIKWFSHHPYFPKYENITPVQLNDKEKMEILADGLAHRRYADTPQAALPLEELQFEIVEVMPEALIVESFTADQRMRM